MIPEGVVTNIYSYWKYGLEIEIVGIFPATSIKNGDFPVRKCYINDINVSLPEGRWKMIIQADRIQFL